MTLGTNIIDVDLLSFIYSLRGLDEKKNVGLEIVLRQFYNWKRSVLKITIRNYDSKLGPYLVH